MVVWKEKRSLVRREIILIGKKGKIGEHTKSNVFRALSLTKGLAIAGTLCEAER